MKKKFYLFFYTPLKKIRFIILSLFLCLISLPSEILFYLTEMSKGVDWGSPGLMIYTVFSSWLFFVLLFLLFAWICLRRYRKGVFLFVLAKKRKAGSSLFINLVFTIPFYFIYLFFERGFSSFYIGDFLVSLTAFYILLIMRASLIASL